MFPGRHHRIPGGFPFRAEPEVQGGAGEAGPVALLEDPIGDAPLRIQDKGPRKGDAEEFVSRIQLGVQDAVLADDLRADVGQQRIGDPLLLGKGNGDPRRIMADRGETQPASGQGVPGFLQLDQLRPAIGSPVGGSKEDEDESVRAHEGFQGSFPAGLIGQVELRHRFAHLGTEGTDIEGWIIGHGGTSGQGQEQKRQHPDGKAAFRHARILHHPVGDHRSPG